MKTKGIDNTKLGLFVMAGVLFLVLTLYMIGRNRNLFGSTFTIQALFSNVNGLVPGNNVRFKGIDVGTVKSITIVNDTSIYVTLVIDENLKNFIKKNSIVSIGTDGLMGNKLVNINSRGDHQPPIEPGDVLASQPPVETDEMLRTLNTTNENIERITTNLFEISVKLNKSKSLWSLLSDSGMSRDLKMAVADLQKATANTADVTNNIKQLSIQLQNGKGLVNKLFTDTVLVRQLAGSLHDIQQASNEAAAIVKDIKTEVSQIKKGDGTAGLILADTTLRKTLMKSALNIEQGTARFNQDMEALKSNFLFRGYFKRLEKEQKKKK